MKPPSARRPVFLDATGQRRRTLRRAGAFLAVPIVGYLILMSSSLLGGPSLDTPLIPQPDAATKSKHGPQITPPPAAIEVGGSTPAPDHETEPSDDPSTDPSDTPSAVPTVAPTTPGVVPPTAPTTAPTTAPSGSPTAPPGQPTTGPTTTPSPTPATTHNGNKPTTPPPGQTKTPGKP
ncbi:hypothetical protein E0H73_28500 [Kribbella pittospori]|uniref:Uncharacterized protein n=1 Tax=Kribbella pittospori TaxID=722689 RepID=A0A4R0KHY7_9ACTN|nr:hypothetical protein [Kribbella pittospori]TCC58256.1 hypothetical protein E0H73_28500 [Kribbella pittospori]